MASFGGQGGVGKGEEGDYRVFERHPLDFMHYGKRISQAYKELTGWRRTRRGGELRGRA